jgi:hypothetical protein
MMRKFILFALATISLVIAPIAAMAASSNITFQMRSFSKYAVEVKFFSKNRNVVWPTSKTVYVIKNYDVAKYNLSCIQGERICYGAVVRGNSKRYWGVSTSGKQGCSNCCYVCNGGTTPINNLNE